MGSAQGEKPAPRRLTGNPSLGRKPEPGSLLKPVAHLRVSRLLWDEKPLRAGLWGGVSGLPPAWQAGLGDGDCVS